MSSRLCIALALLCASLLAACGAGATSTPAPPQAPAVDQATPSAPTTAPRTDLSAATPALVPPAPPAELSALSGAIQIDGSSTVFPITESAANAFGALAPGVKVTLGVSGTGGGFKRFCAGETTISNASRPITADESATCAAAGIAFVELPVAYDGISLVVNAANSWAQCLTMAELRQVWEAAAEGKVTTWRDVRAEWPATPLNLYGAGADSGTFDYFVAAIIGEDGALRSDYTGSEDDYLLAQDLVADQGGLGFLGYAYFVEYEQQLRALAVDGGAGCVGPSEATIAGGEYQPLSRPIFIYVRADQLARPEVTAFLSFYLTNAPNLVRSARSIPLPPRAYTLALIRLRERVTGTVFSGDIPVGVSVEELLELERGK